MASLIEIEPINVNFDYNKFRVSSVSTDISNNIAIITFDELDSIDNVVSTKTIVASGTDYTNIFSMSAVNSYVISNQGFIPI